MEYPISKHCNRVREYFQLSEYITTESILFWCVDTYKENDKYTALMIALDTVIAGMEIRAKRQEEIIESQKRIISTIQT